MSEEMNVQPGPLEPAPETMNVIKGWRWQMWVLGVLLLLAMIGWGSRERSWSKQVEQVSNEKKLLSDTLAVQKSINETMKKESEATETIEPVLVGGQVAYVTKRTSRTIETAMKQATEQIAQYKQQVSELQMKLTSKESETVKSAPLWNLVAGWEPIQQGYYAGGGMNVGPLSLTLDNPVALEFRPRLSAMVRF